MSDALGDSSAFLWSFLVNSERPAWPAPLENLYLLSTSSIISTSDVHLSLFQYPLISCKQVRFQLHHTSTHLHKLIQILGGCKWNRNLVYFFKYNLVLCCQNSSLPSLLPYLPRFPCCCCQKLCRRCPCPYFPPWPLLPSKSFLGLYVVHCASVWFLWLSLSFGFLALILPPMIPTSHLQPRGWSPPAPRCPALRSDTDSLHYFIIHAVGSPPSAFPNLSLLFSEAFQYKVNTSGTRADPTAPSCFISPPPCALPFPGTPSPSPGKALPWSHAFQCCKSPSCRTKYQILSWNTDTVNSGHCFCLIYRINNVEKEFKDVFQTGPSFF